MNDPEIQALQEFYRQRPEYAVQANGSMLLERASRPLTVESLIAASTQLEGVLLLAPQYQGAWEAYVYYDPEKKGTAFRRAFLEGMREKELARNREHAYNELIAELGDNLRGLPITDLQEIAATRRENARRKSLTSQELHDLCKQENVRQGQSLLPVEYTPIGKTQPVLLTAQVLREAGRRNADLSLRDLRFLCDRYTSASVNERMNGVSKPQYKSLPPEITRAQVIGAMRNKDLAPIWMREYGRTNLNNRIFGIS